MSIKTLLLLAYCTPPRPFVAPAATDAAREEARVSWNFHAGRVDWTMRIVPTGGARRGGAR